jgi:hypothetical protein
MWINWTNITIRLCVMKRTAHGTTSHLRLKALSMTKLARTDARVVAALWYSSTTHMRIQGVFKLMGYTTAAPTKQQQAQSNAQSKAIVPRLSPPPPSPPGHQKAKFMVVHGDKLILGCADNTIRAWGPGA